MLQDVGASMRALLALHRATLRAFAALSPDARLSAAMALEAESERAANDHRPTAPHVERVLRDVREDLHRSFAESELTRSIERVLVDAAAALPEPQILRRHS